MNRTLVQKKDDVRKYGSQELKTSETLVLRDLDVETQQNCLKIAAQNAQLPEP